MKVFVELTTEKVDDLLKKAKEQGIKCEIKVSKVSKSDAICKVVADDENWLKLRKLVARNQLLFDYYEDNEYIAPPFK